MASNVLIQWRCWCDLPPLLAPHAALLCRPTCGDDAHRALLQRFYHRVEPPGIRAVWLHLHKLLLAGGGCATCHRRCNLPLRLLLLVCPQLALVLLSLMPWLS